MKSKFIFVTGGVISGLGKGVSAASLGRLLKSRGFSIFVQKLDPYLNVDPGLMSPYEHGEVYVTKDGGEVDLDLGHYERFIGSSFTKNSNFTSGQIYKNLLEKERSGGFNGKTVQIIPHVTQYIENIILSSGKTSQADFVITEVGGTVGDIESEPYMHALSFFANKHKERSFFIHATYVPFLEASKEFKSKPTQHSIKELRRCGINPNMILLRSNKEIPKQIIDKTVNTSFVEKELVINLPDLDNVYKAPLFLENKKMAEQVLKYFKIDSPKPKLDDWKQFVKLIEIKKDKTFEIAMVGKYVEFEDAYLSIIEALKISCIYKGVKLKLKWIKARNINKENIDLLLKDVDGVLVLPGFGERGFEGKVIATTYLRDKKIPTLGICYGLQAMVVSQAKIIGYSDAVSRENNSKGTPIIDIIESKKDSKLGGTLRLGENETKIVKNTLAYKIYKSDSIFERHRHRYEVNPKYKNELETQGFKFSGYNVDNNLAEIVEYEKHPFYIGVQYHPEFNSNPLTNHPLFSAFIEQVNIYKNK